MKSSTYVVAFSLCLLALCILAATGAEEEPKGEEEKPEEQNKPAEGSEQKKGGESSSSKEGESKSTAVPTIAASCVTTVITFLVLNLLISAH